MPAGPPPVEASEDAARLDQLRRRLYRAGATEADVQRYVADRDAHRPPEPAPVEDAPRRRAANRQVVAGAGLALIAIAALALALQPGQRAVQETAPVASPVPERQIELLDIGDGQVLQVVDGAAVRDADQLAFVHGSAAVGQRFRGRGNAVVDLDVPDGGGSAGGRTAVALSSVSGAAVQWRALLIVHGDDRTSYPLVLARGLADQPDAATAPRSFIYPASPPSKVAVEAPAGSTWTLEVALSSGLGSEPR